MGWKAVCLDFQYLIDVDRTLHGLGYARIDTGERVALRGEALVLFKIRQCVLFILP